MVEEQLRTRGIRDERVLAAMAKVPRERFIASEDAANAYGDYPCPSARDKQFRNPTLSRPWLRRWSCSPEDRRT